MLALSAFLLLAQGMEPPGRGAAVVTADPDGPGLVVYGGIGAEPRAGNDLWTRSADGWARSWQGDSGPDGRFNAAGAVHPATGLLVVHGGGGIDEALGDTWAWDGTSWSLVAAEGSGPSPRTCARMVHREATGELILYGGATPDGRFLRETWSWNGRAWRLLDQEGPPGACFHGLAYDPDRDRIVHMGGRGSDGGTWEWGGGGWRRLEGAPPPRDHHAMGWDPVSRRVIVHGGGGQDASGAWDGSVLGDTWAWDGRAWTHLADTGPTRYHAPGMAVVPELGGLVLVGGSDRETSHADVWLFDGGAWNLLAPDSSVDPGPPT